MKHPSICEHFAKLNIDVDPTTKQRPSSFFDIQRMLNHRITEVPTIIVQNGEYVLTGEEAFQWLDFEINKKNKDNLEAFNPNEMGSFSDMYAQYGSTKLHDAKQQSFKFINKPDERIDTPQEVASVSPDEYKRKQKEREQFEIVQNANKNQMNVRFTDAEQANVRVSDNDFSSMMNTRNMNQDFSSPQTKNNIDFTGANFGFAGEIMGKNQTNSLSQKQKEIDSKLQQLLSDRKTFTPDLPKHKIDFTTGRVID
jgi:hypothetical protein